MCVCIVILYSTVNIRRSSLYNINLLLIYSVPSNKTSLLYKKKKIKEVIYLFIFNIEIF